MRRREFIRNAAALSGAIVAPALADDRGPAPAPSTAQVAFVKTRDRAAGVARAIDLLGIGRFDGRDRFVKPNYNSADPPPGSTHEDTLVALLGKLRGLGAGPLTVGDRSGMGNTRAVMEAKQVFRIAKDFDARVVVLDELGADDWELIQPPGSHWRHGFALPRRVREAGGVVQTCCLKAHRFGGHFTLSLKNSVGLAAATIPGEPHDFMGELHRSPPAATGGRGMKKWLGVDGVDAAIHGIVTICVAILLSEAGGPNDGEVIVPLVFGSSAVVFAIRRRIALRKQPPELGTGQMQAEQLAELEARVADLEQVHYRVAELEERLDFSERLLAQQARAPRRGVPGQELH